MGEATRTNGGVDKMGRRPRRQKAESRAPDPPQLEPPLASHHPHTPPTLPASPPWDRAAGVVVSSGSGSAPNPTGWFFFAADPHPWQAMAAQQNIKDLIQRDGWAQLYTEIRRDSSVSEFPALEAAKPENRTFNRYRDVYPYDHSRVKLEHLDHTDYINASLVKSIRANRNYILSQGPLPGTVGHFWLTVWQQMSKAVLMLNRVLEKGQLKCHQYWPQDVGDDLIFEDVQLKLENIQSEPGEHYTVRTFSSEHSKSNSKCSVPFFSHRISKMDTDESREIKHFHYTTWPDFGIEKEGFANVNIKEVLLELRSYRMGLIQTPDQLKFSYLAIIEGARQRGLISKDILAGQFPEAFYRLSIYNVSVPPPHPRSQMMRTTKMFKAVLLHCPHLATSLCGSNYRTS
eukprot:TCALIF_07458-PA protein Name:"Similar to PTPN1 Tyrosine-protein phosphatase non-receptor type 1 (Homo sapiens)" AED:0.13 eAED:0.13 QI:0/0.22/0.4/0.9/0.77/0.8/10/1396/401